MGTVAKKVRVSILAFPGIVTLSFWPGTCGLL